MLAIALVADAVLCAVFALFVRVGGPPSERADSATLLQRAVDGECHDEGAIRAQVYELFLEGQRRALEVNEEGIAGPIASEWRPVRRGWFAQLSDDEAIATEMRIGLGHLAWCEDRRAELARELAAPAATASAEAR